MCSIVYVRQETTCLWCETCWSPHTTADSLRNSSSPHSLPLDVYVYICKYIDEMRWDDKFRVGLEGLEGHIRPAVVFACGLNAEMSFFFLWMILWIFLQSASSGFSCWTHSWSPHFFWENPKVCYLNILYIFQSSLCSNFFFLIFLAFRNHHNFCRSGVWIVFECATLLYLLLRSHTHRFDINVVSSLVSSVLCGEHQTSEPGSVPSTHQLHAVVMWRRLHGRHEVPKERRLDELTYGSSTNLKYHLQKNENEFDRFYWIDFLCDFSFSKENKKNLSKQCFQGGDAVEKLQTHRSSSCVDSLWASPVLVCLAKFFKMLFL